MVIRGIPDIRDAYRDEQVARQYVERRFEQPLGALLHARQAASLLRTIREARPERILEIAPGPARLTVEVAAAHPSGGTVMDASAEMLAEARRRLDPVASGRWAYVQGDVFRLPFAARFDFIFAMRLIRHFEDAERTKIYAEIHRVLRPGGVLMFDAVNEVVSKPLRSAAQSHEYRHYDALVSPASLRQELSAAGFEVVSLEGVQHRYPALRRVQVMVAPRSARLARLAMELIDRTGGQPLEWIVTCRRR